MTEPIFKCGLSHNAKSLHKDYHYDKEHHEEESEDLMDLFVHNLINVLVKNEDALKELSDRLKRLEEKK